MFIICIHGNSFIAKVLLLKFKGNGDSISKREVIINEQLTAPLEETDVAEAEAFCAGLLGFNC